MLELALNRTLLALRVIELAVFGDGEWRVDGQPATVELTEGSVIFRAALPSREAGQVSLTYNGEHMRYIDVQTVLQPFSFTWEIALGEFANAA